MKDTLEIIILLLSGVVLAALLIVLFEFRRTIQKLNEFLAKTEQTIPPMIEDMAVAARNLKDMTEDMDWAVRDVRQVTSAVKGLAGQVQDAADFVGQTVLKARASIEGVKAGFSAAFGLLGKNLLKKGDTGYDGE